jgi:hypothetical protein
MRWSAERILTTHTGSLPRPPELTRLYRGDFDADDADQTPLSHHALAGGRGEPRPRSASAGRGGTARNDHRTYREEPGHLRCSSIHRRGAVARRGVHRRPLCGRAGHCNRAARAWQSRFRHELCVKLCPGDRCWRAYHALGRCDGRLLRTVWKRRDPQDQRLKGKKRRDTSLGVEPARAADFDGRPGGARSRQGYPLDHRSVNQTDPAVRAGQDRRIPPASRQSRRISAPGISAA